MTLGTRAPHENLPTNDHWQPARTTFGGPRVIPRARSGFRRLAGSAWSGPSPEHAQPVSPSTVVTTLCRDRRCR